MTAPDTHLAELKAIGIDFSGRRLEVPAPRDPVPVRSAIPAGPAQLLLGKTEFGAALALDLPLLAEGRLLIQGLSGAGKSWTLRRLLEQSAALLPQVVIDPEGEFKSLAEHLGHVYVAADQLDAAALQELALRARHHRASLVLDLSQLERDEQIAAFTPFVRGLVAAPTQHWQPMLVAIDEAQLFAPFGGESPTALRREAIAALVDLMSRGRKRGLAGIVATLRLARLAKSVASEAQNLLIGINTLDLDIARAAELIGWTRRKASDRLPLLRPGEFVAVGRAFSTSPAVATVGPVVSRHVGATPSLGAPFVPVPPQEARALLGLGVAADVATPPTARGT